MKIYQSTTESADRQIMRTPPGIAEWCAKKYGCNLDLAATRDNRKFTHYFSDVMPVGNEETAGYCGNALIVPWVHNGLDNAVGFCNPPYADLAPWLQKAHEQAQLRFTSVFLIPTFNGDAWARCVWAWAKEIIFIEGRINFIKPDGLPLKGNGRGSMLVVFGPRTSGPAFGYIDKRDLTA